MLKSLIKGLVLVATVALSFSPSLTRAVYAQRGFEPGILGISNAEVSEWQSRYGAGFNGCDFPPPPYCGAAYPHPPAVQKPPSACRVPKVKSRKNRK
jgi:hypothetical protein